MPLVSTIPSAKDSRNLAGRVRRLLSSIVCSYSPRSIQLSFSSPLRPTLNHIGPQRNPIAPRKGVFDRPPTNVSAYEFRPNPPARGARSQCGGLAVGPWPVAATGPWPRQARQDRTDSAGAVLAERQLAGVGAAAREHCGAAAGGELDRLLG